MSDFDEGVPSFEDTMAKIAALQSQEAEPADDPAPENVESKPASVPDVPADAGQAPTGAQEKAPEGAQPAPTPSKAELVSTRLRKILEREQALIEREKALEAQAPKPTKELTLSQLRALYQRDRVAALKALDEQFKPGALAKELWYHDLGDLAPKEAKADLVARQALTAAEQLQKEMEEREQRLRQEWEQRQAQMAYQQYVGAIEVYSKSLPETVPLVRKFAEKKPEKVVQALVGVAEKHARATGGREVLTPEQAAAKLEASLRELQLADPAPVSSPPPAAQTSASLDRTPNTLRNKHTSVQPSKVTDDDLDDEVLRQRAMAAIERLKRQAAVE